jgi:hypothetical protein
MTIFCVRKSEDIPEFFLGGIFFPGPQVHFNGAGHQRISLGDIGDESAGCISFN